MAQSRQNTKVKESIRVKSATLLSKDDSGCDTCPEELETDSQQPDTDTETQVSEGTKQKTPGKARGVSSIKLRSNNKSKQDIQLLPDVGGTGTSPTTHSNMKTKQAKEDQDKSLDEDTIVEPKTRARKKASDVNDDDKKTSQDEPKTSKDTKKTINKPKTIVKKRPLGIRKTLRGKKTVPIKEKVKNVIKQTVTRGRKAARRTEPVNSQDKETVPLIPASEIKKEPVDDTSPSRSCSPKTAGRRPRLSSDMIMMKSMLADSPSSLVLGPRTSPYSMRSERSNSPSLFDGKNLRSGKPRKVKSNLLNEVVKKEQKKRRRLLSDSKNSDTAEGSEDCKKPKRGRSCSRDGSEISKCSDNTESDLSEALNDTDSKELNKKLDKSKTDLDVDIENNVQISTIEKVPSLNVDSKLPETKPDAETSCIINEKKKNKLSLKRSTSLDSDNNNSNRVKLENLNSSDIEDKLLLKTENNTLLEARSSILTSMSKTFNSKEVSKNMRKARRGRKAAAAGRPAPVTTTSAVGPSAPVTSPASTTAIAAAPAPPPAATSTPVAKNCITNDPVDDKIETLETLSKEIDDLINNLDQNIDHDHAMAAETNLITETSPEMQTKSVSKFYSLSKPLNNGASNTNVSPETPVKDRSEIISITSESTPSKNEDSENIRLHYEEDSVEKSDGVKHEITYKCSTVASIDKLMDRLKEFEELDKRRQRQESESKSNDSSKGMMVTNDVVLITKSGADIKPLKDIQSVRSPEKTFEKENVLSCFENNSAISIVKRDHVRKSIDVDLPNSVTLIKRNSFSSRKESTSSNHSKESDAISIFEKSLGKDVTLTEIRKSVDKSATSNPIDLHPFATLHPNNPTHSLGGVVLDTSQISITPRVMSEPKLNNIDMQKLSKRKSQESLSRKSSESTNEEEKMATLEKIKSPPHQTMSPAISITPTPVAIKTPEMNPPTASIKSPEMVPPPVSVKSPEVIPPPVAVKSPEIASTPVAIKSPEAAPIETEALPPPTENIKSTPQDVPVASEIPKVDSAKITEPETKVDIPDVVTPPKIVETLKTEEKTETPVTENVPEIDQSEIVEKMIVDEKPNSDDKIEEIPKKTETSEEKTESKESKAPEKEAKPEKIPVKPVKSARNSIESQPGTSNMLNETPESQKRKENVLRTLGLLTHKAAKEAKIEKLKEKERIYLMSNKTKGAKSGSGDYTGTLKTVIKLNRGTGEREKKKHRSSLKMTFQKSKYRTGKPTPEVGEPGTEDAAYYTIERREGIAGATSDGGQRKSHYSNRLNNYDPEAAPEPAEPKETLNLVIPEKASSFSIHPGRLCQDQCFYCGGKFGLFDTPCHIAQIKSSERQKKVLDNEEKLTIDSCLCDACYRHVDRRANCPSYRKRPIIKQPDVPIMPSTSPLNITEVPQSEKPPSPPPEEESEEEPPARVATCHTEAGAPPARVATCHTEACVAPADHSIRRKWLIKMRSSVNKVLKLKGDYPGLHTIPLCGVHWRALAPLAACALCTRRLHKHHNMHIVHHGYTELNPHLSAAGLPVQFSERPVLCKACRYYCTLLQREHFNDSYARGYRRKLLQIYNIEVPPLSDNEHEEAATAEDGSANTSATKKKKQRTKSKQRKSSDPDKPDSESSEKTNESTPEKEQLKEENEKQPLEEDIESLISSNKILVPGAVKPNEATGQSDGSETEMMCDVETPLLHLDKQTELQYLLQKQNNPAQFMQKPANLTQKQKNILKLQTISGIQKPGQQHRINEKNAKRLHKLGQIFAHNEKVVRKDELEIFDDKSRDGIPILKNISLNDECTIESIPNKRPADINTLKNKWQMSESFTQVKKNLSELSKKLTVEKEPKKFSDQKYSNPVRRLETNPSISVRELFPGEEEMNLQCNIEFNNVKGVTPEGWEKCNTLIQYDVETRKLWNELQRPYGNQSSFLRHLILLEKYFRSGDLVLSHNATPHAANYSDSVQSRLRAYDNVVNDTPRRSEPAISLIEYRKKPSLNGKSLLKSNQNETDKDSKKFMPPPMFPKPKPKSSEKSKSKPLPPELIAINTPNAQGRKAIQNVLHNIQQLVKGVSASDPTEVAAAPLPLPKYEPPKEKKEAPKADTPKKVKTTSKPWRPTLMPITQENLARIGREPTQVAVDGRNLPSLVQVMSSGKRYHITLQDYNKMCIMRREKLQQLQDKRPSTEDNTVVTEIQPSTMLGNGGTLLQNITVDEKTDKKDMPELGQIGSNAATILKNVGLKNITIAPIPAKTATITSQTLPSPVVSSPSLLVTSTPIKIPQLGPAVSITSETIMTPNLPIMTSHMIMPKIPKSLTVIPQTVMAAAPQNVMVAATVAPPQGATGGQGAATDGPRP